MKTGIVLEGGAFRTIFSCGVCDALLDTALPDYVVGVSAGIAYGVSYVSRQRGRNLEILTRFVNDKRYMGFYNLLRRGNRSYFGLEFIYTTIPDELVPFDYDAYAAYPGQVEAVVTDLDTGRAECALPIRKHRGAREKRYSFRAMPFFSFLPCRKDFGHFQNTDALIVNIDLLSAVIALRVGGRMDNDFLHKLMQDTGRQFRYLRVLADDR